ncbi:MAG: Kelch repeat-containing protein [Candidatus Dadabacteria bacterium]
MAESVGQKTYFTFSGGLNTDGSPLTNPENTAEVLENFILESNGTLRKRMGLAEEGATFATGITFDSTSVVSVHVWESLLRESLVDFFVIQVNSTLYVLSMDATTITNYGTIDLTVYKRSTSLTVGNSAIQGNSGKGYFFVASPEISPFWVKFDYETSTISHSPIDLLIRDLYGKDDGLSNDNRPSTLSAEHEYNLLNQGWRKEYISKFFASTGTYPANSDVWYYGRKEIPDDDLPYLDFVPSHMTMQEFGNSPAPKGHFILNVLDGSIGSSSGDSWYFVEELDSVYLTTVLENRPDYSKIIFSRQNRMDPALVGDQIRWANMTYTIIEKGVYSDGTSYAIMERPGSLNTNYGAGSRIDLDLWRNGTYLGGGNDFLFSKPVIPDVVAFYAGRVFYAGSSSQAWAGTVFFSQVLEDIDKVGLCYQDADPTSEHISDLIATDGGTVLVENAVNITAMLPYEGSLVIFAENGVWELSGSNEAGFKATEFRLKKITEFGTVGAKSIVSLGSGFLYWSRHGIFALQREQVSASLQAVRLSKDRIQNLYNTLSSESRKRATAYYDKVENKVYWLYSAEGIFSIYNHYDRVLVLDLSLEGGAFYTFTFDSLYDSSGLILCGMLSSSNSNVLEEVIYGVVVGADTVVVGSDPVVIEESVGVGASSSGLPVYLLAGQGALLGRILGDTSYRDLKQSDYVGRILTRFELTDEKLKKKQIKYLKAHFGKDTGAILPVAYRCAAPTGWTQVANMPTGVEAPYGVTYKNYFYVFGGSTTQHAVNSVNLVQRYNKFTNTWDTPTTLPYGAYRENIARLLPNGKIYVAGGAGPGYSNQAYWYDPETNTWEHKNNLPFTWCDPRIGLLPSGKLLISGGSTGNVAYPRLSSCYIYDPAADSYTLTTPLNIQRGNHTQVELADGRIMVLAGNIASGVDTSSYEIYDEQSATWTLFSSSPVSYNYPGMISTVCGTVFAWGGHTAASLTLTNTVYEYDVATNIWTALPNFPITVAGQAYGQFSDGKIIACGGYTTNMSTITNKTYIAG